MGTLHTFPGAPTPQQMAGVSVEIARATDLLTAVRDGLPRNPGHSDAQHEMEVLGRAVLALQRARPIFAAPEDQAYAHAVALIDEALVLADLCGQAIHQLDVKRQAHALPVVLNAITDAIACGPEVARPPLPQPPDETPRA